MAAFSDQFSLREVIGNLAPGAIVLSSIFYVFSKTSYYQELTTSDPAQNSILQNQWIILVIAFVTAYGIGMLLTSLTQTIFNAVTKLGVGTRGSPLDMNKRAESSLRRAFDAVTKLLKRFVTYLSGGKDITSTIREFRASWQELAVKEGVISERAFDLAAGHYRSIFNTEPAGEESLFYCELYIRDRLPAAAQEIEQNAAKAALMGNLIIPVLCWLIAIGIGLTIANSQQDQKSPEVQKLELDIQQAKEKQKDLGEREEKQRQLIQQYQSRMQRSSPGPFDYLPSPPQMDQSKPTALDMKHQLEQLELKRTQEQQKQANKQKSRATVIAELLIFAILLAIFPYIVRLISRLWIEASRNYVRIIILSFSLACNKPPVTEQNKMLQP
jgi:hypothetical protein